MKKSISVLVAVVCMLMIISVVAVSAEDNYSTKVLLTVEETTCTVTEPQQNFETTTTVQNANVSNDSQSLQTGNSVYVLLTAVSVIILSTVATVLWFSDKKKHII